MQKLQSEVGLLTDISFEGHSVLPRRCFYGECKLLFRLHVKGGRQRTETSFFVAEIYST